MLRQYKDGGRLPIWELAANYTDCMIGYHAIPVIVDAYVKGIRDWDTELALEAMIKSAQSDRFGLAAYKKNGFIKASDEPESVSKNLEYAYDDWCIAIMADSLGKDSIAKIFYERAQYYKNLYDPSSGFFRGKNAYSWFSPFKPEEVNFHYTEANAWQYSLFTPQDISGHIELKGGDENYEKHLDSMFLSKVKTTGRHQPDVTGLIGQYAHGNEPSHHMAYLYNYVGKASKTQKYVAKILNEQYTEKPDGLSGNEDCGQMSSWYVLSSLGFYPVTPGLDYYTIGTPIFEKAKINLENNKTFEIILNTGPSTDLYFLDNEQYIQKGISFWQNFSLPEKYYGFFYNYGDLDWAINELNSSGFEGDMARAPCRDGVCSGANSGIYQRPPHFGVGTFGINSADSIDAYRYGPLHIHEVTHSVVAAQWIGAARNPQQSANDASPCWLNEGIAHAAGLSLGVGTYEEYLDIRSSQVTGRHIKAPFNDYSPSTILNYYNNSIPGACVRNPDYVLGYSIGFLTVEAMNAMAGADSAMHMYAVMASGKDLSLIHI